MKKTLIATALLLLGTFLYGTEYKYMGIQSFPTTTVNGIITGLDETNGCYDEIDGSTVYRQLYSTNGKDFFDCSVDGEERHIFTVWLVLEDKE